MRRAFALALLVLAPVVAPPVTRAQPPAEPLAEARALVRAGQLEAALEAYTRLLDSRPDDVEVRTERARVLGWLGRYDEALAELARVLAVVPRDVDARVSRARVLAYQKRYAEAEQALRQVVADNPGAVDAHLALGDVLGWSGRYPDAAAAYETARGLAPADPQPVLGLARLRYWQEDPAGATALYQEALRLDPGNVDAEEGLRRIAAIPPPRRFRLDLGGQWSSLSGGLSDWYQGTVRLGIRPRKGTTLIVGLDQYHRFDRDDTQLTVGAVQTLPADVTLSGSFTYGVDAEVVARQVYEVEASYRVVPWATALLAYRHSNYPGGVTADIVTPGVEMTWAPWLAIRARYYYSHSSVAGGGSAGALTLTYNPEGRISVYVGGAYGRETFLAGTVVEVVQGVDVATIVGGVIWRLTDELGVRLDYAYEDRRGSYNKHSLGAGVFVEF
jgi:YaiO family outer membrane protein